MWFVNETLFVWMVILHAAFLVVPGLFALYYEPRIELERKRREEEVLQAIPLHRQRHRHHRGRAKAAA